MPDLAISNGAVLPIDGKGTVIPDGFVAVDGDRISEIGVGKPPAADRTIDARGGIIMPGLVNAHTHAAMTLFRGLADDLPLMDWLNNHIFPAEATYITPEAVYWGQTLACAEMIRSGTTCYCDMYYFEDEGARASRDAGVRAVLGEALIDFPGPDQRDVTERLERNEQLCKEWADDPLIYASVQPHAPYTCSAEVISRAKEIADRYDVAFKIHLSETAGEVEQIQAEHGVTPVGLLAKLGVLDSRVLCAHAVHLTDADIRLLAESGAGVVHCPESNMKLAAGVAPVSKLLLAGVTVGLGTDGCASNNNLNMLGEMTTAALLHKVANSDPTVMDARTVVAMATRGSARGLGLGDEIGTLEAGKRADVIVIDTDSPNMVPLYNEFSHLVYATNGSEVRTVVIGGRTVMEDFEMLTIDVEKASAEVRAIARKVGGV
ncbi:MAG: amidohydrolase [Actinobacteria bacterium]|nr:MAG: amidohydrolase [Actinomycetota bacterium]